MNQILEQIQKEKKLVSLYGHMGGEQTVLTGYILYMTEEELLMAKISSRGSTTVLCCSGPSVFSGQRRTAAENGGWAPFIFIRKKAMEEFIN